MRKKSSWNTYSQVRKLCEILWPNSKGIVRQIQIILKMRKSENIRVADIPIRNTQWIIHAGFSPENSLPDWCLLWRQSCPPLTESTVDQSLDLTLRKIANANSIQFHILNSLRNSLTSTLDDQILLGQVCNWRFVKAQNEQPIIVAVMEKLLEFVNGDLAFLREINLILHSEKDQSNTNQSHKYQGNSIIPIREEK